VRIGTLSTRGLGDLIDDAPGKCRKCGSELVAGAPFCGNCGSPVAGGQNATAPVAAPQKPAGKPKVPRGRAIWGAALLLAFFAFYLYVDRSEKDDRAPTVQPSTSASPSDSPLPPSPPVLPTVPVVIESAVPAVSGPEHFVTPSRNIGCYVDDQSARCDIAERDWTAPPKPQSCEFGWGQGLVVTGAGADFVCAGDTTLQGPAILDYGGAAQRGNFRCEVSQQGVTCTNTVSGKGFKIARAAYDTF
jgi:hypothetical protein